MNPLSTLVSYSDTAPSIDEGTFPALQSVYASAVSGNARQVTLAEDALAEVQRCPPKSYPSTSLSSYFSDIVLGSIPETLRYDDVFWCCFLGMASGLKLPEFKLGGPIHHLIYTVYDDFDPRDVAND